MTLLRVFETEKWFKEWMVAKPNLELLLRCFETDRRNPAHPLQPVSVFEASDSIEEVEDVAAYYGTFNRSETRPQYCVRVEHADCKRAGIRIDHKPEEGTTGIKSVDGRHFNLNGDQTQFIKLVGEIVSKLWEGQDRLRVFAAHQLSGQLAVFLALDGESVQPEAMARCRKALSKNPGLCSSLPDGVHIQIKGEITDGNQSIPVVATRSVRSPYARPWWHRFVDYLLGRTH